MDDSTQTKKLSSPFPILQHELDIVETKYKLQEKESTAKLLEIELKFKNDLATESNFWRLQRKSDCTAYCNQIRRWMG